MDREVARVLLDLERIEDDPKVSVKLLEESLGISRAIGAVDLEASALHLRADRRFGEGRFDEAITDLNAAIEKFKSQPGMRVELANAYVSLGRLLRAHGRPAEAIEYYDRAAVIQEEVGDLRGLVQSTNAKAIALNYLGRNAESRQAYERALELAKRTGSPRIINFQQGNLAAALAQDRKFAEANQMLDEVIARETDPYILAYRYAGYATNQSELGQFEGAVSNITKAIELAKSTNNREFQLNLYYRLALYTDKLGQGDAALAAATEGVEVAEQLRAKLVPRDFLKRGFSDISQNIFGLTISFLYKRGDFERALVTSEQARARAFLDLLASRDTAAARSSGAVDKAVDPNNLASESAARTANAADISETSHRLGSTLVSYWVSDDETFIWVVRDGQPVRQARVAIKRKQLEELITASLRPRDARAVTAFARLHTLLIEPVRQWLPARGSALTVVPYGALSRLSFAALRDPAASTWSSGTRLVTRHRFRHCC